MWYEKFAIFKQYLVSQKRHEIGRDSYNGTLIENHWFSIELSFPMTLSDPLTPVSRLRYFWRQTAQQQYKIHPSNLVTCPHIKIYSQNRRGLGHLADPCVVQFVSDSWASCWQAFMWFATVITKINGAIFGIAVVVSWQVNCLMNG